MNKSGKVFLACSLGAFIGSIVAFQLGQLTWWLGSLVGGLIGYIAYEFENIPHSVSSAWKYAKIPAHAICSKLSRKNLKDGFSMGSWMAFWMLFVATMAPSGPSTSSSNVSLAIFCLVICYFFGLFLSLTSFEEIDGSKMTAMLWKYASLPAIVFYWIPVGIYRFVKTVVLGTPRVVVVACRFFKHLFVLIHSDVRLLCGVDAAIGAAVGYFFHNPVLGALAGGLLGILNYEVVSKRLLKVVAR